MSTRENKELIRRLFDHFRSHDLSTLEEIRHPDMIYRTPEVGTLQGIDAYREVYKEALDTFPDLEPTLEAVIAEGDKVFSIHRAKGTMRGDYAGIPPTNRPSEILVSDIFHIKDGKVAEHQEFFDVIAILRHVEALEEGPQPGASSEQSSTPV